MRIAENFMTFIHKYTLEMILIAFMCLGFCWAIGYFANALYGYHFELQSCWAGFTSIGGAGVLAAIKYCMDSWKNTPEGVAPQYGPRKPSLTQQLARASSDILEDIADNGTYDGKQQQKEVRDRINEKSRLV